MYTHDIVKHSITKRSAFMFPNNLAHEYTINKYKGSLAYIKGKYSLNDDACKAT